jgi:hypothetical protein
LPVDSSSSLKLFAFANDGAVAWLREGGSRLVAVDPQTGEMLRHVRLDPAPFGLTWRVERHGAFFVVRDDHEIAAYDDTTGTRLWKRSSPTDVAFAGEHAGDHGKGHVSVIPAPGGEGIDIALADLATGAFEKKLRVNGSMTYVGTHGTLAGDLLFVATDQRDVFAIDLTRWEVAHRHRIDGLYALPPVATPLGVHVASIERRANGFVTHVATLDRVTGHLVSSHELPGAAHSFTAGTNGLLLESRRSNDAPVERIAFRPDTPSVRLRVAKHVDMRLVRDDAPRFEARHANPAALPGHSGVYVDSARNERAERAERERDSRHDEIVPMARDGSEPQRATTRDGLLALLALLGARSDVLVRLTDCYDKPGTALARLERLGVTLRDPRVRWSARTGRDPCLLDVAVNREGDAIATYFYPQERARTGRVPVVLVSAATGEARWLADDFDVWFAGVLSNATSYAPEAVRIIQQELGLPGHFPRPLPAVLTPAWFFEAYAAPWTIADADAALAAGDVEGAERMLVAVGRTGGSDAAKERLASVYTMLGWDHHRATVVETW